MKRTLRYFLLMPFTLWAQPGVVDLYSGPGYPVSISGGRFFFAALAGILLAYGFQWILTCLSLATGISSLGALGRRSTGKSDKKDTKDEGDEKDGEASEGASGKIRKIETGVGLWGLLTTCIALFFACWLAMATVPTDSRWVSVALGLTIWAGFLLSMAWLESAAMGSILGSLTGMIRSAGGAVAKALPAVAGAAKEGVSRVSSSPGVKEKFKSYLESMPARPMDRGFLEREVSQLFSGEIGKLGRQGQLQPLEQHRFEEMVSARGDISREESRDLAEVLHAHWTRTVNEARESEAREGQKEPQTDTREGTVRARLGDPFPEAAPAENAFASSEAPVTGLGTGGARSSGMASSGASSAGYSAGGRPAGGASRSQAFRDFLRNSDKRELNPTRLQQEVETILVANEGGRLDPNSRDLSREDMVGVLRQRRDITLQEADSIADIIDAARTRTLSRGEMRELRDQEAMNQALSQVRDFVYSLKRPEPDYEGAKKDLQGMFSNPSGSVESLRNRLAGLDRESILSALNEKGGFSREEAGKFADMADKVRTLALEKSDPEEARRQAEEIKKAARESAEATRATVAMAAWWLVAISVGSGIAAALGALAGRS